MKKAGIRVVVALLVLCGQAEAAISRVYGPAQLLHESRAFIRFDAAFDTVNRVYLVVWGTQLEGPVNGLFMDASGNPIGGIFAVSGGSQQSGWARAVYSPEQRKFLVSYTKIVGANQHQKVVRFVTYTGGIGSLGSEVVLDAWTGHAGTESGVTYAAAAQRFLVTWWRYSGQYPVSFAAAIDTNGTSGGTYALSSPADGQSDPEIACDPSNRRCLVVGWAWGTLRGGGTALWGRYISDANGAPQGEDAFYLPAGGYLEEPTVAFSASANLYVVAYTSNGQVWANTVAANNGAFSAAYPVRHTSAATIDQDGGGSGFPSLVYNAATQTMLLSATTWAGYGAVQEIDSAGTPIAGALDFIPDPGHNPDFRNKYTIPAADSVSSQFLVVDNHFFKDMRVSRYAAGTVGSPPPPPSPPAPPPADPAPPPPVAAAPAADIQVVPFNFNGDVLRDVLLYNRTTGAWSIQLGNAQGQFTQGPSGTWIPGARVFVADFNGNGLDDLFVYSEFTGAWSKVINTGSDFWYFSQVWQPNFTVFIVDLNADGKSDAFLYNFATGLWFTAISTGNGMAGFDYGTGGWLPGFHLFPADFDGDGRTDFLLYNPVNGVYYKAITRGNGIFAYSSGVWAPGWAPTIAELNGDGRADVFLYHPASGTWYRALSTGDGTGGFQYQLGLWAPGWTVSAANFDGNILTDLFLYNPTTGVWYQVFNWGSSFTYSTPGMWSEWRTKVVRLNGDILDDVLLFNPTTSVWYQAITTPSTGGFTYTVGTFPR
jgi:hypothetical protein